MHKNFVFASTSSGGICQLAVKLPPRSVATTGGIHTTRRCFSPGTPSNPLASAQFRQRELHTRYSEHRGINDVHLIAGLQIANEGLDLWAAAPKNSPGRLPDAPNGVVRFDPTNIASPSVRSSLGH